MAFKLRSSGLPFKEMGSSPAKQLVEEPEVGIKLSPIHPKAKDTPAKQQQKEGGAPVADSNREINEKPKEQPKPNWKQEYLRGGEKGMRGRAAVESGTGGPNPDQKETTRLQDEYFESPADYKESPAKQIKNATRKFNIGGYLKGEQGLIPDYKGESTKKTVDKVVKKVAKANEKIKTTPKRVNKKASMRQRSQIKKSGQMEAPSHEITHKLLKKSGKLKKSMKTSMPISKIKPIGIEKLDVNPPFDPHLKRQSKK